MNETIASITLSILAMGRMTRSEAALLCSRAGSAVAVMENRTDISGIFPEASPAMKEVLGGDIAAAIARAESEAEWCDSHGISMLLQSDSDYPERMKACHDAPLVLFKRGNADLNPAHSIAIVGTRECTAYGKDVIGKLVSDLSRSYPDVLIVSGLAYGVDIQSHRAAMERDMPTVGVVAHGMDTLYPAFHKPDAARMVEGNGAVVTEYVRSTRPEPRNFLQRNRIIAAMADATIVIESAHHGGSLVTARLAREYERPVFSVPGPVNSPHSIGTNNLIRNGQATMLTCADDLVSALQWERSDQLAAARRNGIERDAFPMLTPNQQRITDLLRQKGDLQSNAIALHTGLPISTVASELFALEMSGVITSMPGSTYHLIG